MKRFTPLFAVIALVSGCSLFGTNPSPPSPTEQKFFNTVTNYVQVPLVVPGLPRVGVTVQDAADVLLALGTAPTAVVVAAVPP